MVTIFIIHYKKIWVPKLRKASYSVYKHPSVSKFIIPVGHRGERNRIKYIAVQVAGCAVNNSILCPQSWSFLSLAAPIKLERLFLSLQVV